ncbi:hypothetical protein RJ640_001218, partial [Escallonia rubra]
WTSYGNVSTIRRQLTCPPESLETGEIANDVTGLGTFTEVMVYLTDPSVNNCLGKNASEIFYSSAYHLDPRTTMFMNEYNTIEYSGDEAASLEKYIEKLKETKSYPRNAGMLAGIGLQSHFNSGQPNIAYMRVALDILGATGLSIWLTEVDVQNNPNQSLCLIICLFY